MDEKTAIVSGSYFEVSSFPVSKYFSEAFIALPATSSGTESINGLRFKNILNHDGRLVLFAIYITSLPAGGHIDSRRNCPNNLVDKVPLVACRVRKMQKVDLPALG